MRRLVHDNLFLKVIQIIKINNEDVIFNIFVVFLIKFKEYNALGSVTSRPDGTRKAQVS